MRAINVAALTLMSAITGVVAVGVYLGEASWFHLTVVALSTIPALAGSLANTGSPRSGTGTCVVYSKREAVLQAQLTTARELNALADRVESQSRQIRQIQESRPAATSSMTVGLS